MTTKKVFRSVIFSAVSRKFQAAAFLILLMAGGRLLSAQALLQAGIASVTGTSPDLTLDLKMTNAGNFTALRVSLRTVTFKVLSGDGSVSLTSPTLPTPPADILAGSSTDVHLNVHLTGSVQRFSVTEAVNLANGPSVKYVFTATQTVDLASPTKTLSFTPTSLTYAAQTDGTTSVAQSVTVNSIGTASVALSNIQLTGANAADYAISANTCGPTLASGANCSVSITFTPSAIGTRTAALTFTDDASGSPQAVPITGTGQTKTLSFIFP